MEITVNRVSDLLPLTSNVNKPVAIDTLTTPEREAYEASADAFVDKFNSDHPDGLEVKVRIDRLNFAPNKQGRVAIVVAPSPNLNTTAFTYPVAVGNTIAQTFLLPDFVTLASVLQRTHHDPSFLKLTIKAVKKGQTYAKNTGEEATYKAYGVVTVGREEVVLSKAANDVLANMNAAVDAQASLDYRKSLSQVATPVVAMPTVPVTDEDVLGS